MLSKHYVSKMMWIFYIDWKQYWKCDWTMNISANWNAHGKRTKQPQVTELTVGLPDIGEVLFQPGWLLEWRFFIFSFFGVGVCVVGWGDGGGGGGGGGVLSSNAFTIWCCVPIWRPPRVFRRFKRRSCNVLHQAMNRLNVKRNAFSPWHIAPEIRIKWIRWSHVKTGRNVEHKFNYFIKMACYNYHLRIKCERCGLIITLLQVISWRHSPSFRRLTVRMYTNNLHNDVWFVNHYNDVICPWKCYILSMKWTTTIIITILLWWRLSQFDLRNGWSSLIIIVDKEVQILMKWAILGSVHRQRRHIQ